MYTYNAERERKHSILEWTEAKREMYDLTNETHL